MRPMIRAHNIEKTFGDHRVLRGIDIEAGPEEAVAIIGANGAGKTTLLKILTGVLSADAGRITLDGDDLEDLDRREIARRAAVVPQGVPQVFDYTVLEFVLMGHHARNRRFIPSDDDIDEGRRALQKLELETFSGRPVSHLSGGELQRALIARAIVASVPVWLLDEPTASLDMRHQIAILEQLRDYVDAGNTAISVLHDLALVHRFFDRVIALCDGQIRADGPPDDVLTPAVVSEIYGVSMERGKVGDNIVWVAEGR